MSLTGIIDKALEIFKKPLKLKLDPSLRIERELEKLDKERREIVGKPQTPSGTKRLDWIDDRQRVLREEQARIAARA